LEAKAKDDPIANQHYAIINFVGSYFIYDDWHIQEYIK